MSKRKASEAYTPVDDPDVRTVIEGPPIGNEPLELEGDPILRTNSDPKHVESKADKFKRLANKRVPAALKRLQHVANLAYRAQYDYTDEQAAKVIAAIDDAAKRLRDAFSGTHKSTGGWSL